jgi:hypothetical protein
MACVCHCRSVDVNEDACIDFNEWCALMRRYFYLTELVPGKGRWGCGWPWKRPPASPLSPLAKDEQSSIPQDQLGKMRVLFGLMDTDGDGTITLREFLSLMEVLALDVEVAAAPSPLAVRSKFVGWVQEAWTRLISRKWQWMGRVVAHPTFELTVLVVIFLAMLALFIQPSAGTSSAAEFWFGIVDWFFTAVFLAELVAKVCGAEVHMGVHQGVSRGVLPAVASQSAS